MPPGAATAKPSEPATELGASEGWTFAVLSDLHVRPDGAVPKNLRNVIRAVIATRPRFVAIIGDFTYGQRSDPIPMQKKAWSWWGVVREELQPLRAAGIPVLPIAGNHDSELHIYRKAYAYAWRDLERWAAPLAIHGKPQPAPRLSVSAVPFTYSTEVDGVHMTFAHVVSEKIDPGVTRFIRSDLAGARSATLRFFFGHVPLVGMGTEPRREFRDDFGRMLEAGHVDVYVAGHEHFVWDEDVALPAGGSLRQVVVGTASSLWRFGPNTRARKRARCKQEGWGLMHCRMPRRGVPFDLYREGDRWLQQQPHTFTLFTIEGRDVTTHAFAVHRNGSVSPFGNPETPHEDATPSDGGTPP